MNTPIGGRFVVPELAVTHFHLRPGDVVADYGAGSGFFLTALSKAVGPDGKVYAVEIQKQLVEKLGETARMSGLGNVQPLWCDLEEANGIKIGTGELDSAVLVNTLFMIEDKVTSVTEMARTVRAGGKFFVLDWTESFAGMGPAPDHVVSETVAKDLFESAGLIFERSFEAGDHHYGLAFRKV